MATPLPPDPYAALGVSRNADSATIKSAYRKLALKCHPDKVTDESLKAQKQEEFHKIQQAYELIGEEEKRAIYDAEVKLDQLRREKLSRSAGSGPSVEVRTAGYGVRTQAPAGAAASMDARGPSRYDVPKSSSRYADDYYEKTRSRAHDTYDPYPKHSSTSRTTRTEREKDSRSSRTTSDRTRSDEKKSRDKDERRERTGKYGAFVHMEDESSSGDDKVRFEGGYRRRNEEEEARKKAAEARRRADEARTRPYDHEPRKHRSSDDDDLRKYKMSSQESEAMHHIGRTKYEADRPSPSRTTSSRDVPQYYVRKSDRPEAVRRSSAQRKDRPSSSGRESLSERIKERLPEIVEWGNHEERKVPSMPHAKSSPAEIHVPRATPQRSYTTEPAARDSRRGETSPTPAVRRADTMPHVSSSSSRRKEATVPRQSGLRNAETTGDSGYSSSSPPLPSYGTAPPTTRKLYYPTTGGGVSLRAEDVAVANGHRTVFREPERARATSPTPIGRPPMGPNRPAEASSQRSATVNIPPPPPLGRSATTLSPGRGREEERGRSRKNLYGEIPARDPIRENRQPANYSPDRVAYAKKYGPEDIRWTRGRDPTAKDREYDYVKPSMQRSTTYAY
ncbi:hypothetical protein BDV96DRAFT_600447 [Lophiotrema nucula]|uniref:J domain-containing protein n=1 Tax=Lophiotrema nucula TaxID=690887 RepID=A0A6A5Z4X9_9PLEO|nr:hypothetical protein BDV96DRAFT_600447 [Lophiotrema nucula]